MEKQISLIYFIFAIFIDDKGKAKVTADLLDELFISRKKETLQGKYTQALKGVFGMSFYLIDVINLITVLGSEYYSLYNSLPLLYNLCSFEYWYYQQ